MTDEPENEFMKRGYLLPNGCKDLIDVQRLIVGPTPAVTQGSAQSPLPIIGGIAVLPWMTVKESARALKLNPFRIIADLMGIGVYVSVNQKLDFTAFCWVIMEYGFIARKAA
jgi:hypothetical protein